MNTMKRIIVLLTILALSSLACADPTANSISVSSASGDPGATNVLVLVNITNVMNGPIQVIGFDVIYDHDVIELVKARGGPDLPTDEGYPMWAVTLSANKEYIGLTTNDQSYALSDGTTGNIVKLYFNVKSTATPGQTSPIELSNVDISSTELVHGTIPAINGDFTVTGEVPDLTITAKSETLTGSTLEVTYTVKNTGGVGAGASTTGIYVDGIEVATDSVGALAAGASHTSTVTIDPFNCPCGTTVTIKVCADNENAVDESDETNNCLENAFSCPSCAPPEKPDLTITAKSETLTGSTLKVTYTVTNNGGVAAGASTTGIYAGSTQIATDLVGALAAGASHTRTVTIGSFDCPCGTTVTIKVCADEGDAVDESDETNNCRENVFNCPSCPGEPDLTITAKSETLTGSTLKVTYTVKNTGGVAAGASTTGIYAGSTQIATDLVGALAAGASHTRTVTIGSFDCPCGTTVTIKVCADKNGAVDESDETNNCRENTFNCPLCAVDPLLCAIPGHNFRSVPEGQTRTWPFEITNCGGGTLTWTVSDDHSWITVSPTGGTETGTVTVTINTAGLSPGTHTGTVTVDSNGGTKTGTISMKVKGSQPHPPPSSPTAVPTFTPIGMFAMVGLLGIAGMSAIRRK